MNTAPTITGGRGARIGIFLKVTLASILVRCADMNVDNVPKITSIIPKGLAKFEMKHPKVSPVMACGENTGKIVNA